jgi:hypothetical protein
MSPAEPSFIGVRDVLDRVVRELACAPGPLEQRLPPAGRILLGELSARDFQEPEERAVFARLQAAALEMSLLAPGNDLAFAADVLHAMVHDLVDLHEMVEGRAIRETADYWAARNTGS